MLTRTLGDSRIILEIQWGREGNGERGRKGGRKKEGREKVEFEKERGGTRYDKFIIAGRKEGRGEGKCYNDGSGERFTTVNYAFT